MAIESAVPSGGSAALSRLTPDVSKTLTRLGSRLWDGPVAGLLALADLRVADLLDDRAGAVADSLAPLVDAAKSQALARWPWDPQFSPDERVALGFAEQFVIDVSGIDHRLRAELCATLGTSDALSYVMGLFVLDYTRRVRMSLVRLFPDEPAHRNGAAGDPHRLDGPESPDLFGSFDDLSRSIALLDALDPVTTELVRLRGARQHNCRLCQSTRSVRALEAGADELLFDATEHYETSTLPPHQKVALRLTDAIITQPASISPTLVAQVHQVFTPAQVVELIMDVMRNSGQKVAVAMGADEPHVASGVERFEITAQGAVVYLD